MAMPTSRPSRPQRTARTSTLICCQSRIPAGSRTAATAATRRRTGCGAGSGGAILRIVPLRLYLSSGFSTGACTWATGNRSFRGLQVAARGYSCTYRWYTACPARVAQDHRMQEHHQIALELVSAAVAEQVAQQGNIAQQGHFLRGLVQACRRSARPAPESARFRPVRWS
jgi:hypothetical protein